MLKLFQIGDTPIHFHQQHWHGWDIKGRGKTTEALWSHHFFFQNRQFQMDQQSIKLSSIVIDEVGMTARQQVERLHRLVDLPTTIIAYDLHTSGAMDSCLCQAYGRQEVMWYTTAGVLSAISEEEASTGVVEISLTLTVNPHWTALNRYLWSWQGGEFDPFYPPLVNTPYANFINHYPKTIGEFGAMHWSRRPVDRLVAYDPDLWAQQHLNTGLNFYTGFGSTWGAGDHAVYVDDTEWSAPPLTLYAFKNLPNTGGLYIRVNHVDGTSKVIEDLTAINLTKINQNLLDEGLTGLQTTDTLYFGDGYPKPGFLVRGGAVIAQVIAVTYPRAWPGQLMPGKNGIRFELPSSSIQVAYTHSFRRT